MNANDADERHAAVKVSVGQGTHTPVNKSITVAKAAEQWLEYVKGEGAERSTTEQYQRHADLHIVPRCGGEKLATLTTPRIEQIRIGPRHEPADGAKGAPKPESHHQGRSPARRGRAERRRRRHDPKGQARRKPQACGEVDIPSRARSMRSFGPRRAGGGHSLSQPHSPACEPRSCAGCGGLISTLKGTISVRQRADAYNDIGEPKSASGVRSFPLRPIVISTLREWKNACPHGELVFPNGDGHVENLGNILKGVCIPLKSRPASSCR